MIEVRELVKNYGSKRVLDHISFDVNKGEILGLLGANGAGKTTTMNIMTGNLSSTGGTVRLNGHEILEEPLQAKKELGYLPENPPLYPDMTVKEYLKFAYRLKKCRLPYKEHIEDVCKAAYITDVYDRVIKNLSKGYRQRIGGRMLPRAWSVLRYRGSPGSRSRCNFCVPPVSPVRRESLRRYNGCEWSRAMHTGR